MQSEDIIKRIDKCIIKSSNSGILEQMLNDDTDLISDLMFDSISIISLVVELEDEFDFEFDEEYLILEHLRQYRWIVKYIETKVIISE